MHDANGVCCDRKCKLEKKLFFWLMNGASECICRKHCHRQIFRRRGSGCCRILDTITYVALLIVGECFGLKGSWFKLESSM